MARVSSHSPCTSMKVHGLFLLVLAPKRDKVLALDRATVRDGWRNWRGSQTNYERKAARSKVQKAPQSEVKLPSRIETAGGTRLPWTIVISSVTSASGQRAVLIGPALLLEDANGCSGRGVPNGAIAASIVSKQLGVMTRRASQLYRASDCGVTTAPSGAAVSAAVAPTERVTDVAVPPEGQRQPWGAKILRRGGANGRAAMNISGSSMNRRAGVFAVWRVAWLCVACWIARRAIETGVGIGVVSA